MDELEPGFLAVEALMLSTDVDTPPSLAELLDAVYKPAWHRDAACREHPDVTWFPGQGEPLTPARAVCDGCLVRDECLEAALEGAEVGVWAGTSEQERRRLRRAQRAA